MARIVYLNGEFLPEDQARLPIFDRGLLFADAVYEGLGVLDGQVVDFLAHMRRLRRSLAELAMPEPLTQDQIFAVLTRLIADNRLDEGFLYLHVTRGAADRDYLRTEGLTPNVFAFTQPQGHQKADDAPRPVSMASTPDLRWARRDIKTSNLLGQVLAKKAAQAAGAEEALMIAPDGHVTEGGSVSFFIVRDGALIARPVTNDILHGITRQSMLAVAEARGMRVEHRRITLAEVLTADEAFITGASSWIEPVGQVDGQPIGNGQPGPVTLALRADYLKRIRAGFYKPGA